MALESIYTALPLTESDRVSDSNTPSLVYKSLKYVVIVCTAAVTAVLLAIAPVYDIHIQASSSELQNGDDLAPPILVVKPEMKRLHYCGLDPDNAETLPRIPPLGNPEYELVQVQAFIRHGARFINSPEKCWPGQDNIVYNCSLDELAIPGKNLGPSLSVPRLYRKRYMENRNFFNGDCRLGQLTLKGHRQEVALGGLFREAYVNRLVDSDPNPNQVFFRSHDMPRTMMSAQAFISGMFPEHSSSDGLTSIVDIWTMDSNDEDEIINPHKCPGVDQQREQARSSQDYIEHEMTVTARINQQISKVVGVPVEKLGTNKFDCFFVSLCQGDPVPDGIDEDLMHGLEAEARYNLYHLMQYPDRIRGSRLTIGPLLYEILDAMKSIDSTPRFSLYSGHDSGPIMLLLSAFGIEDEYWAPFASYISLEVYRRQGQHFVRFLYNGSVRHMEIAESKDGLVPLDVLEEYLVHMLPTIEECPQMRRFMPSILSSS